VVDGQVGPCHDGSSHGSLKSMVKNVFVVVVTDFAAEKASVSGKFFQANLTFVSKTGT
jgi:hypothetical protein